MPASTNLSRLVMGRPERRWRWPGQKTLGDAIEAEVDDLDVLRVALPKASEQNHGCRPGRQAGQDRLGRLRRRSCAVQHYLRLIGDPFAGRS